MGASGVCVSVFVGVCAIVVIAWVGVFAGVLSVFVVAVVGVVGDGLEAVVSVWVVVRVRLGGGVWVSSGLLSLCSVIDLFCLLSVRSVVSFDLMVWVSVVWVSGVVRSCTYLPWWCGVRVVHACARAPVCACVCVGVCTCA